MGLGWFPGASGPARRENVAQTPTRTAVGPYVVVEGRSGAFVLDAYAGICAQCSNPEAAERLRETLDGLGTSVSIIAQGGRPPVD